MVDLFSNQSHGNFMEHWLYDQRMLWPGQFAYRDEFEYVQIAEEQLLRNRGNRNMERLWLHKLKFGKAFGIDIEVLPVSLFDQDPYYIVLPHSTGVMSIIKQDPTTVTVYGDRKAGKTVTSWTIAWELYNSLKETKEGVEIYVAGDADAITKALKAYSKRVDAPPEVVRFANVIQERTTYEMPESTGRNQVLIYNEIGEDVSSKRGMARENLEITLRSMRVRHERRWMIFNVIRPQLIDISLRESPIQIFHHSTKDNMASLENMVKDPWKPIMWTTSGLRPGEALAIYSLLGYQVPEKVYTTAIDKFSPKPPAWLLDVIQAAKGMEIEHANEIEFMRNRGGKQSKMPKGDVIRDQAFTLYVKSIRDNYPRINVEDVYHFLIDWQVRHLSKRTACTNNHVHVETVNELIREGFIQLPGGGTDAESEN